MSVAYNAPAAVSAPVTTKFGCGPLSPFTRTQTKSVVVNPLGIVTVVNKTELVPDTIVNIELLFKISDGILDADPSRYKFLAFILHVEFPIVISPLPPVPILITPVLVVLPAPIPILPVNDVPLAILTFPLVELLAIPIPLVALVAFNVVTLVVPFRVVVPLSVVVPAPACPKVTFPLPVAPLNASCVFFLSFSDNVEWAKVAKAAKAAKVVKAERT